MYQKHVEQLYTGKTGVVSERPNPDTSTVQVIEDDHADQIAKAWKVDDIIVIPDFEPKRLGL